MRLFYASALGLTLCVSGLDAQAIDYPDSTITSPAGQYPIYTPTNGNTCRVQIYCPSTFAKLPKVRCLVSKVGIQLASQEDYSTFVMRAGTTSATALTNSWTTNLPDQRIQLDLSGTKLMGGGSSASPANIWVEFDLNYPFVFNPGDALVADFTSKSKVAGTYCRTAIGSGVPRAYDLAYTPASKGPTGVVTSGGIKLRFVFQPIQWVPYGSACAGAGKFAPKLTMTGTMKIGSPVIVKMSNGLGGAPTLFFLGLSPLLRPVPIGGGCELLTPLDFVQAMTASGTGAGQGASTAAIPIPNNKNLIDAVVNTQWAQLDNASSALVPFTLSNGGKIVIQ